MEMEKIFYVVRSKPAYYELLRPPNPPADSDPDSPAAQRVVVSITQGGFGQDVIDDERQAKERFLEHLFVSTGLDLQRSAEVFDEYFLLEPVDEFVDLDE